MQRSREKAIDPVTGVPRWQIRLFGGLHVFRDSEEPLRFDTRQTAALLAYLAFYPDRIHSREVLSEMLWPDENGDATRSRFRTALWSLRRCMEHPDEPRGAALQSERGGVQLIGSFVRTDVADFDRELKRSEACEDTRERARHYLTATELYTGELLPGCYEDWVSRERERLAEAYRACLGRLAAVLAEAGDTTAAIEYARLAVAHDPLQESAHLDLIRFYIQSGRGADAKKQYKQLDLMMVSEFGVPPSCSLAELIARLPAIQQVQTLAAAATDTDARFDDGSWIPIRLESEGGAVPLESSFYIERETDALFIDAVLRRDSIVLVKGARQTGKTSLLSRGLQRARDGGMRVVHSDLQRLTSLQLQSSELLFQELAREMADQLDLELDVARLWNPAWGWNVNFERFLRRDILGASDAPLVWGLDEVDRLFGYSYSSDVFGLFRSWHNARSLNPSGPWGRFTVAMAYATEVHLFITDLNQSPFNVGTRLALWDFGRKDLCKLNQRYGRPLKSESDINRYFALVGGNPYLIRLGLHSMVERGLTLNDFENSAGRDDSVFADALRRMRASLLRNPELVHAINEVLSGKPCPTTEVFFCLQSAGILIGASRTEAALRCKLYEQYLRQHPL